MDEKLKAFLMREAVSKTCNLVGILFQLDMGEDAILLNKILNSLQEKGAVL